MNQAKYDDDQDQDSDLPYLELSRTNLVVVDGELQRLNKHGGLVLRLPLSTVEAVEMRNYFDPFSLIFLGLGAGLAWIGYAVSENNILTIVLYVAALLLAGLAVFGCIGQHIIVQATTGVLKIHVADSAEEGAGFVASLNQILRSEGK